MALIFFPSKKLILSWCAYYNQSYLVSKGNLRIPKTHKIEEKNIFCYKLAKVAYDINWQRIRTKKYNLRTDGRNSAPPRYHLKYIKAFKKKDSMLQTGVLAKL